MTTTTEKIAITEAQIKVMQAFADGADIEVTLLKDYLVKWLYLADPDWNWELSDYRIKPKEPREVWVSFLGAEIDVISYDKSDVENCSASGEAFKFREVLEDE